MPELPDVETFRRYFASHALRRRIASAQVSAPEMVKGLSARSLRSRLADRRFVRTHRHGKFLFAGLDRHGWLVLHFGMTGFLAHYRRDGEAPGHTRLRIDFTDGSHLAYDDQRKFGRIAWTDDVGDFVERHRLGVDPLETRFDAAAFRTLVRRRKGAVKAMLMNQAIVAGIGNIYADEILFQARLHPAAPVDRLSDASLRALHRATRRVLSQAVRARADVRRLPRRYLLRARHAGGRCPNCGRELGRTIVGGRTTYFCPRDQQIPETRRTRAHAKR